MASEEHSEYQDITIETVDRAVRDWFDNVVNVHVRTPTEELKKVPVLFASGERWATARDQRGIRDKNGLLILPLISVRRTNIDRDKSQMALGTETKTLTISKQIAQKTNLIQNTIAARNPARKNAANKVVHEVTTIPFPDWFNTGYEIIIQTQYTTQMNKVLEKIFDSLTLQNSFVMPVELSKHDPDSTDKEFEDRKVLNKHYFVGFMDTDMSDTGNFEEFTDQERIIRYSYNINVPTYLQLDPEGTRPSLQVKHSSYKFSFKDECVTFVDDPIDLDDIFSTNKPKQ